MISKNVLFSSFHKKKNKNNAVDKKLSKIKWIEQYPLLKSFTENYTYSYNKSIIKKYIKSKKIRIVGMGGSSLGSKSIYSFLKKKIKKKVIFLDNLKPQLTKENNCTNIVISKSGDTYQAIINKLDITEKEFLECFKLPKKTFRDYKSQSGLYEIGSKIMRFLGFERGGKR